MPFQSLNPATGELLATFPLHEPAEVEARLRAATTAKSWAEAAHTLKGSALGIGAFQVASAAEAVECDQIDHLSSKAWNDLARLEEAVRRANAFIADILKAA